MAFNTNNGSNNEAKDAKDDSWKAHGFINLYVANRGGGRNKLGTIALKKANERERMLSEWLAGDDDNKSRLTQLINAIQFEYNPADTGDASHFDLPFDQAPAKAA